MLTQSEYRASVAGDMSESTLQARVIAQARALGWLVYHTHDSRRSQPGFPDLVLVHAKQGRVLYRELKTQRGRPRPEQTAWLEALNRAGQDAKVWRPLDLLTEAIHPRRPHREPTNMSTTDENSRGEYFDPAVLPHVDPNPPPSAQLVTMLTADIRRATRTGPLNTPALAEMLVTLGWRPTFPIDQP